MNNYISFNGHCINCNKSLYYKKHLEKTDEMVIFILKSLLEGFPLTKNKLMLSCGGA